MIMQKGDRDKKGIKRRIGIERDRDGKRDRNGIKGGWDFPSLSLYGSKFSIPISFLSPSVYPFYPYPFWNPDIYVTLKILSRKLREEIGFEKVQI
jgi:hypothetical protein